MENTVQRVENVFNARKFIVWLLIVSSLMAFAGLVSAFVVMRFDNNRIWTTVDLPQVFLISTVIVFVSSIVMQLAYTAAKKNQIAKSKSLLVVTLLLGLLFGVLQYRGLFVEMFSNGFVFFGQYSTASSTFVYLFACLHMFHLLLTMFVVMLLLIKSFQESKYDRHIITFHNSVVFWHFLGVLWVFLYLFLYIYR